jgi:hypothetical protein
VNEMNSTWQISPALRWMSCSKQLPTQLQRPRAVRKSQWTIASELYKDA